DEIQEKHPNLLGVDLPAGFSEANAIITCLPNSKDVKTVVDLASQDPKNLESIRYWIDATSGSPKLSQQIAAQLQEYQVDYLDCAVSGGPTGASSGSLTAMIGGKEEAFYAVKELIQSFAKNLVHLGPVGSGHAVKAVNNTLLAANILSVAEAMITLKSFDVPLDKALSAINTSSGRSWVSQQRFPDHVLSRTFDYGFSFGLHCKDVGILEEMINDHNLEVSVLRKVLKTMQDAFMQLNPDADHLEVIKMIEDKSGFTIQ
ncbi:MAG: NAD(P)-dependent oxidoreductase, partial [Proteobacteria bacterium]|nr:NAD(P)-dependent oxidoreductase [Pseudomonadota bacterium]